MSKSSKVFLLVSSLCALFTPVLTHAAAVVHKRVVKHPEHKMSLSAAVSAMQLKSTDTTVKAMSTDVNDDTKNQYGFTPAVRLDGSYCGTYYVSALVPVSYAKNTIATVGAMHKTHLSPEIVASIGAGISGMLSCKSLGGEVFVGLGYQATHEMDISLKVHGNMLTNVTEKNDPRTYTTSAQISLSATYNI